MSIGAWMWAAVMAALAIVYLRGMRSDGLTGNKMLKIALVWVAIILGAYVIVSWLTGMS
ncbi:hypothetical protein GRI42_04205 [Erythrobacter gaetbuli]|uniref:Uncharacterized protein n=1 Tax=Qipengyuania gaetbuli TaxID=266952 RepID=A0A844XWV4_9SPHN|nr:hypothetical protein [Qipengyuania gaetbuli]MXO50505.1 hypothetical protein [Qipengyuania gaetbuli]